jgi:steroid 5-alpha reductase family enzyme
MKESATGRIVIFIAYLVSFALAYYTTTLFPGFTYIRITAVSFVVSAFLIFLFSAIFNNSSMFDPYWSLAPIYVILLYFSILTVQGAFQFSYILLAREFIVAILVGTWGIRLTWNFLRNWKGLKHEDWRYVDFRHKTGKAYWPVSLLGIHLFPAIMVFLGCLSLWVVFLRSERSFNILDIAGIFVTGMAIWLESKADRQLRDFTRDNPGSTKTLDHGLWSMVRHPNYLGEMTFWWGLYFFALASNPSLWWVITGPAIITIMFLSISIPMIEKRMLARRSGYEDYRKKVPVILPWPGKVKSR